MSKYGRKKSSIILVAGVDVGAATSKAMVLLNGEILSSAQIPTKDPKESSIAVIDEALFKTEYVLEDLSFIVATGWGRSRVSFANETLTEIACCALAAVHLWGPSVRTILDAGGESLRVIHCNEKGVVSDFLWNDKCAQGIGRSLETLAFIAGMKLQDIGEVAIEKEVFPKLSDFCPVYALSELFDMLREKIGAHELLAAYHYAMAKRISTLVLRGGLVRDFVMVGGLAKNPGIVRWVEKNLETKALRKVPRFDPSLVTAYGAALFANRLLREKAFLKGENEAYSLGQ